MYQQVETRRRPKPSKKRIFIFLCNNKTKSGCLDNQKLASPKNTKELVSQITADDLLCLYNFDTQLTLFPLKPNGDWYTDRRSSNGFNGRYPIQINYFAHPKAAWQRYSKPGKLGWCTGRPAQQMNEFRLKILHEMEQQQQRQQRQRAPQVPQAPQRPAALEASAASAARDTKARQQATQEQEEARQLKITQVAEEMRLKFQQQEEERVTQMKQAKTLAKAHAQMKLEKIKEEQLRLEKKLDQMKLEKNQQDQQHKGVVPSSATSVADGIKYKSVGNKHFKARDYVEAINWYTKAILADPNNCVHYSNRSSSHARLKNWEAAKTDGEHCVRLDPDWPKGYFRLALAHQGLKLYDIALSLVEKALARPAIDSENTHLISLKKKLVEQQQNAMVVSGTSTNKKFHEFKESKESIESKINKDIRDEEAQTKKDIDELLLMFPDAERDEVETLMWTETRVGAEEYLSETYARVDVNATTEDPSSLSMSRPPTAATTTAAVTTATTATTNLDSQAVPFFAPTTTTTTTTSTTQQQMFDMQRVHQEKLRLRDQENTSLVEQITVLKTDYASSLKRFNQMCKSLNDKNTKQYNKLKQEKATIVGERDSALKREYELRETMETAMAMKDKRIAELMEQIKGNETGHHE
jgi:tetratricopeptide (TPR) repeat protein